MRVLGALLLASTMMAGGAHASSFVVIAPPKDKVSSSFVVVGPPPPSAVMAVAAPPQAETSEALVVPLAFPLPDQTVPTKIIRISTSIIALDSPIPNVAYENVAAIKPEKVEKPKGRAMRFVAPMVMRGGIIGDSFARGPSSPVPVATQGPGKNAAKSTARAPVRRKPDDQPPEEPVKIIIAPPPPTMRTLDGVE